MVVFLLGECGIVVFVRSFGVPCVRTTRVGVFLSAELEFLKLVMVRRCRSPAAAAPCPSLVVVRAASAAFVQERRRLREETQTDVYPLLPLYSTPELESAFQPVVQRMNDR